MDDNIQSHEAEASSRVGNSQKPVAIFPEIPKPAPALLAPKQRRRSLPFVLFLLFLVSGVVGAAGFFFFAPASFSDYAEQSFVIEPGSSIEEIVESLQREGLIRNGIAFAVLLRFQERTDEVKAGAFQLSPSFSPRRVADILTAAAPPDPDITVTIPEGFTAQEIGERLATTGVVVDGSSFLGTNVHVPPYDFLPQCALAVGISYCTMILGDLEGYLFPDTYRFGTASLPEDIVKKFLVNFDKKFSASLRQEALTSGRTLRDIVIVASLVEEEAKADIDRPTIAGILYKRLEVGMPLQVDATVLYAKERARGEVLASREVTLEDLKIESIYNTYLHTGLPAGPIANPGIQSLLAALRPESSPYLFYLHAPDGQTIYSRTLEEHNRAKATYLR